MNKGQLSLDLMMALLVSIIILVWVQGFIEIELLEVHETGLKQQAAHAAISSASIMNNFYAMNLSEEGRPIAALNKFPIKKWNGGVIDYQVLKHNESSPELTLNFLGEEIQNYSAGVVSSIKYNQTSGIFWEEN